MTQQFDIIINGGGMAGATLACGLNHILGPNHSLNIAIIEASTDDSTHPGFDARVIALSYGSRQILEQLNLWSGFRDISTPISNISVTDRGHFAQTTIKPHDYQVADLGYVVELVDSGRLLHQKLTSDNVTWFRPNSVVALEQTDEQVTVTLADSQQLSAKLLVAADGGFSKVGQLLNITKQQTEFNQSAIIANITTSKAHQGWAYERFTEQGPLALLPMSQGRSSLVWSMHSEHIDRLMALPDAEFLAQLQQAFGYRLGTFEQTGKRVSYPLIQSLATQTTHHRCVFIGNAAQALHPIAGQGFNLGLRDVAGLISQIAQAVIKQQDIGQFSVLDAYQKQRSDDRNQTVLATSGLVSIFSNDYWAMAMGRNIGLQLSSCFNSLKQPVAHQMLGWSHDLSPLRPIANN
ncbi:2-octaprenyl-6-methoxyphenyl hydroxylase [Psychrobium sp. 1_MG-2023]|uniref:2-octaprenyl-6-methoxyphenyl hydroxylase n=1 Tax=Psychrobium sp. 1_MG-2023 TaxID=3062624 RepID=UPI002735A89C|nr:2-octaprenyl-6-methoxyphenyl hydroxylase [Psychrobium sp. 1_MG-2023]MDP2562888.1 2-octaprenyl-6-methoxyphenyl hydroxylase [Psychrobium sp. 1_MG-2023]